MRLYKIIYTYSSENVLRTTGIQLFQMKSLESRVYGLTIKIKINYCKEKTILNEARYTVMVILQ